MTAETILTNARIVLPGEVIEPAESDEAPKKRRQKD